MFKTYYNFKQKHPYYPERFTIINQNDNPKPDNDNLILYDKNIINFKFTHSSTFFKEK